MTRTIDSATKTASEQEQVIEVVLADIQLPTPVYVHTYFGDITYDSNIYSGVGDFGSVSTINSTSELRVDNISLSLNGVNNSLVSQAIGTDYQYRDVTLYTTFLDLNTHTINTPVKIFNGYIDNMQVVSGKTAVINLTAVNKLQFLTRPNIRRYNLPDQQSRHPNDVAFKYVDQLSNQELVWGKAFGEFRAV